MWPSPRNLCSSRITLLPLSHGHAAQLAQATRSGPHIPEGCRLPVRHEMGEEISYCLERQADGKALTFAIQANDARLLGWAGYVEVDRAHKKLQIGNYWIATQDAGVFSEIMVMLLSYGFDHAKANTIQMRSRAANAAHRARLQALGGTLDGVLRGEIISRKGEPQDVAVYSILKSEWPKNRDRVLREMGMH